MIAIVAGLCAGVLIGAAVFLVLSRRQGVRGLVGERVVIQTRDDRSLRGVLVGVYADCVAVSHFEYLNEAQATGLPGEATVRFDNLSWVHKLGPGD